MRPFCPLCFSTGVQHIHYGEEREYLQCSRCFLVHVPKRFHLSLMQEKSVYDFHENSPADQHYRKFLGQLVDPLHSRLVQGAYGLDFGSGPGPTLHVMLQELGYEMEIYDKFYAPDEAVLDRQYDFITATEVVEHLADPGEALKNLWLMIRSGGYLAIMTSLLPESIEEFRNWHYKRDPTHISFFAEQSLRWLAVKWQADLKIKGTVAIYQKQ